MYKLGKDRVTAAVVMEMFVTFIYRPGGVAMVFNEPVGDS
jgi:hypothetical protein